MISIIAAIGKNRELGKNNDLIFHIKEDMNYFRNTTTEHPVIMGRKTWESMPGKLKNRINIVVSHEQVPGADETITDLPSFISRIKDQPGEYFVIGGGSIYKEFLPYAKNLYLTEVDAEADADVFFPEFDKKAYTREVIKEGSEGGLKYTFVKYTLK